MQTNKSRVRRHPYKYRFAVSGCPNALRQPEIWAKRKQVGHQCLTYGNSLFLRLFLNIKQNSRPRGHDGVSCFQAASAVAPPFSFATQTAPKVFNHGFQAAFGLSLNAGAMFGSLKSQSAPLRLARKPCAAKNKGSLKRTIPFQAAFTHPMQPENAVADTFQAALIRLPITNPARFQTPAPRPSAGQ